MADHFQVDGQVVFYAFIRYMKCMSVAYLASVHLMISISTRTIWNLHLR